MESLQCELGICQSKLDSKVAEYEAQLNELTQVVNQRQVTQVSYEPITAQPKPVQLQSNQTRRLINTTVKSVMQCEVKNVGDTFLRRFKSIQAFDPFSQVPKTMKFICDLVKIVNKQNKQLFSVTQTTQGFKQQPVLNQSQE